MKKIMSLLILIMVGLMAACTTEPDLPRLATPTGITVNKNMISFNEVVGADKYVVNVNSSNTTISFTEYTITEAGTYQVQIKAVGKNYRDSLYSTPIQVVVGYLNYPTDIHILNNIVNFTAIPNANSYNIEIDGIVYNTSENPPVQLAPGSYSVRVQALSKTYINSPYSPIVVLTVEGPEDLEKLPVPTGIIVNKNHISFDEVEDADQYIISLNSNGIVITDTEYTVTEPGTYEIQIKATGDGFADSDFSTIYNMTVGYLSYPSVVEISEGMILFNEVPNADSYNVEINGFVVNTTFNSIAITEPGTYAVRLQAISSIYVNSPYSPIINLVVEDPIIQSEHTYFYSQISEHDLPLYIYPGGPVTDLNFTLVGGTLQAPTYTPIDLENLELVGNSVYLKASYLDSLTPQKDPYQYVLESNIGHHNIKINVNQSTSPYVYSDQKVRANMYTDVVFRFETYGATFTGLASPTDAPMTEDDYSFVDGLLTIKNSYIKETFDSDPSRDTIIFSYLFNNEGILNVAFIFIVK